MYRIPGTNLVFIHIPKTAGQAVRAAFGMKSSSSAHSTTSEEDLILMAPRFVRFCVVRHPIQRFVSAYLYNLWFADKKPTGVRAEIQRIGATTDINLFIEAAIRDDIQLEKFVHFRPQTELIRETRPQIVLRHENLAKDIKIIGQLAGKPEVELPARNVSTERSAEQASVNTDISDGNMAFLKQFYRSDLRLFGYDAEPPASKPRRKKPAGKTVPAPVT